MSLCRIKGPADNLFTFLSCMDGFCSILQWHVWLLCFNIIVYSDNEFSVQGFVFNFGSGFLSLFSLPLT